ncbi:MAG TPA: ABC transporter permease [Bryobacteraceae bacterium]|jgi:predicted permease|nr:ABC transporter permease [Bryobacteraceae bacterium]
MGSVASQLRQVFRRLGRAPVFTIVAVITLALGIGANVAIFSVLDTVLLKPLPYPQPDRLIGLWERAPGIDLGAGDINMSASLYFTYREENHTFQNLGIYTGNSVSVTGMGEPEQVHSMLVTWDVFPTLGVRPFLGRGFTQKDDTPKNPETVILSYGYWQRRFAGDSGVIGRRILIDGKAKELIGVLPKDFRFLDGDFSLFEPFQFDRSKTYLGNFSYDGVARLKPGVTPAQAHADVARMIPLSFRKFQPPPGFDVKLFEDAHFSPVIKPFKDTLVGDIGTALWVLMGTIGMVLLIACANVANLLLVRVEARHRELLIRAALGAGKARIAGELLVESITLAILGGVAGIALAFGALRLLVWLAPSGIPRLDQIAINLPVLLFALAVSIFTGLLFGSVPVFKYAGVRPGTGLREGGRGASQSRERHRARNVLVVVQVALALVLLVSSALMIRTFRALTNLKLGFVPQNVQTFEVSIPDAQVAKPEQVLRMENDILDRLRQIPGVQSAALTTSLPTTDAGSHDVAYARDHTYRPGQIPPIRHYIFVSPRLQATLGTPLVAGRDFTWNEIYQRVPVAMISENFAREYWGKPANALHKQIREGMNDSWREIVGVVADAHDRDLTKPAGTVLYLPPLLDNFWGDKESIRRTLTFVVRTPRAGSESFLKEVRAAVWAINPNLPLAEVRTLEEIYRKSLARTSFTLVMLGIAAAMALLLGMVGIYGVIAYSVSERRREIGIRMALGARREQLAGMFMRHALLLTGTGALIGAAAAFAGMRLMSSLLFGVKANDPATYAAVITGLLLVAALASYLPSRRAAAVDPAEALRLE